MPAPAVGTQPQSPFQVLPPAPDGRVVLRKVDEMVSAIRADLAAIRADLDESVRAGLRGELVLDDSYDHGTSHASRDPHALTAAEVPGRGALGVAVNPPILRVLVSQFPNAKPYQQQARMLGASADGHGRPPSPQVNRREVRPHLCTRREAGVRTREVRGGMQGAVVGLAGE